MPSRHGGRISIKAARAVVALGLTIHIPHNVGTRKVVSLRDSDACGVYLLEV